MKFISLNKILENFCNCKNWEEKYLFLIELGNELFFFIKKVKFKKYLVEGCQSNVWIKIDINNKKKLKIYGYSDSSVVRGIVYIIISMFKNKKIEKIKKINIYYFFKKINLFKYITYTRVQGVHSILNHIYKKIKEY
ncbi:MAG: SufE family protein [Enterobacteriaceae bacterium]